MQPHRDKYWEHPNITDWDDFARRVTAICKLREQAPSLYASGTNIASIDEKPGIQAIERDGVNLPMKAGCVERREFNYIRHGTQVLIATLHLGTGQLIEPTIQDTRTEADFLEQIERLVKTDEAAPWIFLCDQLNTHKSASLVEYVATAIGDTQDLGVKGKSGILQSMPSRMAYLEDSSHRIRFLYTPKHCSWLDPIEVWFSILTTHRLKRGNFTSIADLKQKLEDYIAYYNQKLAKVWNWSVVKNQDIQNLINKVKQAEGAMTAGAVG